MIFWRKSLPSTTLPKTNSSPLKINIDIYIFPEVKTRCEFQVRSRTLSTLPSFDDCRRRVVPPCRCARVLWCRVDVAMPWRLERRRPKTSGCLEHHFYQMGVEPKIGEKNPKWMVKLMENPIKMDDLGKTHYFRKHPYLTSPGVMWGGGVIFIMMQSLRWYTLQN